MGKNENRTRLQQDEAQITGFEGGVVPTKFTNAWSGPHECIGMKGNRYAIIRRSNGKLETHNVNRLWKNQRWDEHNPDTATAFQSPPPKGAIGGATAKEGDEARLKSMNCVREGDIVVFPKGMDAEDTLPFGVGRVTNASNQEDLKFQWMGNPFFNPRGTFLPGWIQPNDERKYYFRQKPLHPSHLPYLGDFHRWVLKRSDVLMYGRKLLTIENRLNAEARRRIAADPEVKRAFERDTKFLFLLPNLANE